jgi:putative two-component system response regulator
MLNDNGDTKILIADDEALIRKVLGRIITKMGYRFTEASDAVEARALLDEESFNLLLCDNQMPGESGLDLIRYVHSNLPNMAVIMISAYDDNSLVEEALALGAFGFIVKPFKISEVTISISSSLRRQKLEYEQRNYQEALEEAVDERTARLQTLINQVVNVLALSVETRDPYTAGHQKRVSDLAVLIARKMKLPEEVVKGVMMGGLVHDLGKLSVPTSILNRGGKLGEQEFELIKNHCLKGYEILSEIDFPWPVAKIAYQHHERINGKGYPLGLKGDEILLEAKIIAVADVVEAMASHRPYRPAHSIQVVIDEIKNNSGTLYDPKIVDCCISIIVEEHLPFGRNDLKLA